MEANERTFAVGLMTDENEQDYTDFKRACEKYLTKYKGCLNGFDISCFNGKFQIAPNINFEQLHELNIKLRNDQKNPIKK